MYLELKNAEVGWDHVKLSPAERAPVNVLGYGIAQRKVRLRHLSFDVV